MLDVVLHVMPVTTPPLLTLVAYTLLVLHVPPVTDGVSVVVSPTQTVEAPLIVAPVLIVIGRVVMQPSAVVYEITVVPVVRPATIPVVDPTEALVVLLLQVPPAVASVRVVACPEQTLLEPTIADSALVVMA